MNNIRHQPYAAFRYRDFRFFFSVRLFTTMAVQMQAVIVGWQVYAITKDALSLGLIGLAEALPYISLALFGGHLADRVNRKKVIVTFFSMLFICLLILFFFTSFKEDVLLKTKALPVFIAIVFVGIARGFMTPAMNAFFAQLIPRDVFPNAITWNSNVFQFASVAGPAIGGLIYGYFGILWAYGCVGICLVAALTSILLIPGRPLPFSDEKKELLENFTAGIRFVFKNPVMLGAMSLDLFAVLFGGATAVLPIFAADILHVGPQGLGVMRAAPFIGSVIVGVLMAHRAPMRRAGTNLLICVAFFGLSTIAFALSENFYLSVFLLLLLGSFDAVSVIIRQTILNLMTPDHMRGRVTAVNGIFIGSSNEIGAFESGTAAKFMGLVPSVIFGGSMTLLVVLITFWRAPALKRLNLRRVQMVA